MWIQEKALYSIATDYKGFITRDEQIVTLKNDAYVNYSVREGLKTALGSTIYTTQDISAITDALLKELQQCADTKHLKYQYVKNKA